MHSGFSHLNSKLGGKSPFRITVKYRHLKHASSSQCWDVLSIFSLLLKASNFMSISLYIVPIKLPTLLNKFHLQILALWNIIFHVVHRNTSRMVITHTQSVEINLHFWLQLNLISSSGRVLRPQRARCSIMQTKKQEAKECCFSQEIGSVSEAGGWWHRCDPPVPGAARWQHCPRGAALPAASPTPG